MTTVVVAGALANKPGNGGEAWVRLNWILGLMRLGFEVCFVEQLAPSACVDATGAAAPVARSRNLAFFRAVVDRFGLSSTSSLIYDEGAQVFGMAEESLLTEAESAVALINISGHLTYKPLMRRLSHKIYVDIDPGYTQYWHACGQSLGLEKHDEHLTIGANVGTDLSPIPTGGVAWRHVRPSCWRSGRPFRMEILTASARWRAGEVHSARSAGGERRTGSKCTSFASSPSYPGGRRTPSRSPSTSIRRMPRTERCCTRVGGDSWNRGG